MGSWRIGFPILFLLLAFGLGGWLLGREGAPGGGIDLASPVAVDAHPGGLRGTGLRERDGASAPAGEGDGTEALEPGDDVDADPFVPYDIEVLDYHDVGVEGVRVFLEKDVWGSDAGPTWTPLAEAMTDGHGVAHLEVPVRRRKLPNEGLNHRLRVAPPAEREDLAPTWHLWRPVASDVFRLTWRHVIAGRVLDRDGEPVWGATVWLGWASPRVNTVLDPAGFRTTKTDVDGSFLFADIPTSSDGKIGIWALRPGASAPRLSKDIRGLRSIALDDRHVEIRLE